MKLLFAVYITVGLLIEWIILWLFPYTGLGGLICWPTALIFSLVLGFLLFKLSKRQLKKWQLIISFFILISIQSIIQLALTPQDYGGNVFSKIIDAKKGYNNYKSIEYTDFPNLSSGERVAYLHKFKYRLPNSLSILTIDSLKNEYESINPRFYLIENKNGKRIYNESKISIEEINDSTIITEYLLQDTIVYKMHKNFMNIGAGGYNNRIITLDLYEDDLKLDTGIEKLLFLIMEITK